MDRTRGKEGNIAEVFSLPFFSFPSLQSSNTPLMLILRSDYLITVSQAMSYILLLSFRILTCILRLVWSHLPLSLHMPS